MKNEKVLKKCTWNHKCSVFSLQHIEYSKRCFYPTSHLYFWSKQKFIVILWNTFHFNILKKRKLILVQNNQTFSSSSVIGGSWIVFTLSAEGQIQCRWWSEFTSLNNNTIGSVESFSLLARCNVFFYKPWRDLGKGLIRFVELMEYFCGALAF